MKPKTHHYLVDPFAVEEEWLPEVEVDGADDAEDCWIHSLHSKTQNTFLILFLLFFCAAISIFFSAKPSNTDKPKIFPRSSIQCTPSGNTKSLPGAPEKLEMIMTADRRYLAVISESNHLTRESVYLLSGGQDRVLIWQEEQNGYEVSISIPGWKYKGEQVIMMTRHTGAAWAVADILRTHDGKVLPVQTLAADNFDFQYVDSGQSPLLASHLRPHSSLDLPVVEMWTGNEDDGFRDVSSNCPKYFESVLAKNVREAEVTSYRDFLKPNYPAETRFDILQNLALAGHKHKAIKYLKQLVDERGYCSPDLLVEMKDKLAQLRSGLK